MKKQLSEYLLIALLVLTLFNSFYAKAEVFLKNNLSVEQNNENDSLEGTKAVITPTISAQIHYKTNIGNTYFYEIVINASSASINRDPVCAFRAASIVITEYNGSWVLGSWTNIYMYTSDPHNSENFTIATFAVSGSLPSADVYVYSPTVYLQKSGGYGLLNYVETVYTN